MPDKKGLALVGDIGRASLAGTLQRLLDISYDGIVGFDAAGRVLLANDAARHLLMLDQNNPTLVGRFRRVGLHGQALADKSYLSESSSFDMPFLTDGSTCELEVLAPVQSLADPAGKIPNPETGVLSQPLAAGSDQAVVRRVLVRCDTVAAPGTTYLMVVREASGLRDEANDFQEEHIRELIEANHRLSGTLNIVLGTLDSEDVQTLFDRVLEELTDTMEATGCALWLAEGQGFRLSATSSGLQGLRVPSWLPPTRGVAQRCIMAGHALRLQVAQPDPEDLRRQSTMRSVLDEETSQHFRASLRELPPLQSFIVVPVWFGEHIIALIMVGWDLSRPLRRDDARLLDAVAQYLSVQLMGAITALRAAHTDELNELAATLHDELFSRQDLSWETVWSMLRRATAELGCKLAVLGINDHQHTLVAALPNHVTHSLPYVLHDMCDGRWEDGVCVVELQDSMLGDALVQLGVGDNGCLVHMGTLRGGERAFLALRAPEDEPLDDLELSFFHQLSDIVRERVQAETARSHDKRIAQALQRGMRNELQKVDGIRAAGIYSSATADAFVGGDFYDLIRLPDRRACVIMGDVSGKGVEAASVSAAVKTALGAYAWQGIPPAHMVRMLNNFLLGFSRLETFATMFVGVIDLAQGSLTYCSAGHPPALMVRNQGAALEALDVQSGVVGAFEGMTYRDGYTHVNKGDMLLLYTDGTTEARDPAGEFFGERGLREAALREAQQGFDGILDRLLGALDTFTAHSLDDDVAMVALKFEQVGDSHVLFVSVVGTSPGMKPNANIALLPISGDLDVTLVENVRAQIEHLIAEGSRRVILNMGDVHYVDSCGMSLLISEARHMRRLGGLISLDNVSDEVYRMLSIARLVDFIPASLSNSKPAVPVLDRSVQPLWQRSLLVDERRLSEARSWVEARLRRARLSDDAVFDMTLACGEALGNALDHAATSGVYVAVSSYPDRVVVEVSDCGCGFELAADEEPVSETGSAERGRGIKLMRLLADSVSIRRKPAAEGCGTIVRMVKMAAPSPERPSLIRMHTPTSWR